MAPSDLALLVPLSVLLGLAVFACRLVLGIWRGRTLPASLLAGILAGGVLTALAIHRFEVRPTQIIVAGVAESHDRCSPTPGQVEISGQRARLAGPEADLSDCAIWALITDPRTGLVWVQGPAIPAESGWTLDLVLGIDPPTGMPLTYRVALLAIQGEAQKQWLAVALQGTPLALDDEPPPSWLARGFDVAVGG